MPGRPGGSLRAALPRHVRLRLWDRNRQTFFLARDRLGVKPLYYALLDDGTLLFGSELKVLMQHPGLDRRIDPHAVEEYFSLGYVAEPRTIFRGALKLQPAETLCIRRGEPIPAPRSYWDVRFSLDNHLSVGEACAELNERLRESVRLRMIADAPGRLPVRRRRLQRGGGHHGGPLRRPGEHLLDRLRRPGLQRVGLRPAGRRPLPDAPLRRDGQVR
jgi:hypothetical protein